MSTSSVDASSSGRPLRALVVDDEPIAREGLAAMLVAEGGVAVVGEAGTGPEAVREIERLDPDLVFLDIEIPELDGVRVAAQLLERRGTSTGSARRPVVIFVTAYDRFAIRAFEVRALDYVLKPFGPARIAEAVARARDEIRLGRVAALERSISGLLDAVRGSEETSHLTTVMPRGTSELRALGVEPREKAATRLAVRTATRVIFVDAADVDWIEGADDYARLHVGTRRYLLGERLASLERRLDPARFVRVHRSAIVNASRIRELFALSHGDYAAVLHDGTRLRVARTRREAVLAALAGR